MGRRRKEKPQPPTVFVGPCRKLTNQCAPDNGECLRCGAANGDVCRDKAAAADFANDMAREVA